MLLHAIVFSGVQKNKKALSKQMLIDIIMAYINYDETVCTHAYSLKEYCFYNVCIGYTVTINKKCRFIISGARKFRISGSRRANVGRWRWECKCIRILYIDIYIYISVYVCILYYICKLCIVHIFYRTLTHRATQNQYLEQRLIRQQFVLAKFSIFMKWF